MSPECVAVAHQAESKSRPLLAGSWGNALDSWVGTERKDPTIGTHVFLVHADKPRNWQCKARQGKAVVTNNVSMIVCLVWAGANEG